MAGLTASVPLVLLQGADPAAKTVKVVPAESQELLGNPGMGWQTFHRFADDDPHLQGLPSTSAYFRFSWREVSHMASLKPGGDARVTLQWENVGVAPPYLDARVALRLRPESGPGETTTTVATASIRGWQPGPHRIGVPCSIPGGPRAGRHELVVGIVDPQSQRPVVRLAIAGRDPDGWYPVSHLEVAP